MNELMNKDGHCEIGVGRAEYSIANSQINSLGPLSVCFGWVATV